MRVIYATILAFGCTFRSESPPVVSTDEHQGVFVGAYDEEFRFDEGRGYLLPAQKARIWLDVGEAAVCCNNDMCIVYRPLYKPKGGICDRIFYEPNRWPAGGEE